MEHKGKRITVNNHKGSWEGTFLGWGVDYNKEEENMYSPAKRLFNTLKRNKFNYTDDMDKEVHDFVKFLHQNSGMKFQNGIEAENYFKYYAYENDPQCDAILWSLPDGVFATKWNAFDTDDND